MGSNSYKRQRAAVGAEPCKVGKCNAQLALVVLKAMGGGSSREQNPALFPLQAKWEIILYVIFFIFL